MSPLPPRPGVLPLARIALRRAAVHPGASAEPPSWQAFDELARLVGVPPVSGPRPAAPTR